MVMIVVTPRIFHNNDTNNAHNNKHNNKRNRNNDGRANETNQNNQDDAPVGPATYVYGMNEELLLGWRAKVDTPDDKELSLPLNEIWEDGKAPDDTILVVAQWYDNHNAETPGLTWGRLRKMQADRQSSSPAFGNILEGTQKETKHKITVSQRVDRRLLMCMYEQESLVCSINIGDFAFVKK